MADWIILAVISLITAGFSLQWLLPRRPNWVGDYGLATPNTLFDTVFLFDGNRLISHSDVALAGYETVQDWADLRRLLKRDFPTFPETPETVRTEGNLIVTAIDCTIEREVLCEWIDGIARVQLRERNRETCPITRDPNDPIRLAMDQAPYPVLLLDRSDRVRWCNAAYVSLVRKARGRDADLTEPLFHRIQGQNNLGRKSRVSVAVTGSKNKLWFDLAHVDRDEGQLIYATDINAIVEAEAAQRKFVQTMTKTFAQLSIGLAIFDRNRQLALFNPALIDLTNLPPDFLSCRPSLSSFFDRMRDQHMMPEPKNYRSWRRQMNDLVEAAQDGNYQETWSLPSGSVYSVSGRPHPDGAVAFLFEDITAEITLTRRFRAEMGLMQSILDKLADAIAVFSDDGTLALTNYAYNQLWGEPEETAFELATVLDVTRGWQEQCMATPVLGEIRDFVEMRDNRTQWSADMSRRDGQSMTCTVSPMQNGATIVRFSLGHQPEQTSEIQKISA
ncbi:diguanylate cyclase [Ruegeria sp. ANG-S4]|uniref:PAS-domain containing protein n=1 Tax=Ruegeria sp. ANG-S4 TaxID=1577904 RepID=UPI00057CFF1F|nr:PAS-domain containing protein [Ruegeria sp. ANG-S4]KIC41032.1 diguanylate cyclase [Ruegeria sp. ANG-S4]